MTLAHEMDLQLTAVFKKVPEGYIGFVEELPGANTQGATIDEARANLREAVVLEANKMLVLPRQVGPRKKRGKTSRKRLR